MKARRRYFIDPQVRGALALRLCVHWVVYIVVTTLLVVGLKWLSDPFTSLQQHFSEAVILYSPVLLVILCLTPIFVYDSIKLSNRFAGPMFRLRRSMGELADGKLPKPVKLRKHDFWKGFAADFNQVLERIESSEQSESDSGKEPQAETKELASATAD